MTTQLNPDINYREARGEVTKRMFEVMKEKLLTKKEAYPIALEEVAYVYNTDVETFGKQLAKWQSDQVKLQREIKDQADYEKAVELTEQLFGPAPGDYKYIERYWDVTHTPMYYELQKILSTVKPEIPRSIQFKTPRDVEMALKELNDVVDSLGWQPPKKHARRFRYEVNGKILTVTRITDNTKPPRK